MSEQKPRQQGSLDKDNISESSDPLANTKPPSDADVKVPPPKGKKDLTAEEQMALYEKDLKENDWGHQPC